MNRDHGLVLAQADYRAPPAVSQLLSWLSGFCHQQYRTAAIGVRFSRNGAAGIFHQAQFDLFLHSEWAKLGVETAAVALLCYIALTDFRIFKIHNSSVLLLVLLYGLYAFIGRSGYEILLNVTLGVIILGVLFWFYARGAVGGGDVKLVPVVCLWVGTHCALLYSIFLLTFIGVHLVAVRKGWVPTLAVGEHRAIPYAPSVAASLICIIMLGCL